MAVDPLIPDERRRLAAIGGMAAPYGDTTAIQRLLSEWHVGVLPLPLLILAALKEMSDPKFELWLTLMHKAAGGRTRLREMQVHSVGRLRKMLFVPLETVARKILEAVE